MVNIKQVPLSKIRDMPEWVTDGAKVEAFRQLLRDGKGLPSLRLRETVPDETYEVIDGFHRFRALVAEGYTSYACTIETSDERTAEMDRIQASLTQPADVLMQRGIVALRSMFLRDMQAQVSDSEILRIRIVDHGVMLVEPRRRKLPQDPIEAILVLNNHFAAKCLQDGIGDNIVRPNMSLRNHEDAWWNTVSQGWEQSFLAWLDNVSQHLQCPSATIFSYLGFGLIPVKSMASGGHDIDQWFRQLLSFGDEDIQRMILKRIRAEHVIPDARDLRKLRRALQEKPTSAKQVIKVLGEWSLENAPRRLLGEIKTQAEREAEHEAQLERFKHEHMSWQTDTHDILLDDSRIGTAQVEEDNTIGSVFAIVSPNFTGSHSQPPHASMVIGAASTFLSTCGEYEARGGTWEDAAVQSALNQLREWLHQRS